jgi:hypothetical protein
MKLKEGDHTQDIYRYYRPCLRPYDSGESSRASLRQVEERMCNVSQENLPRHPDWARIA